MNELINIINKNDPRPLYSQIADGIREKVSTKEWEKNHQLPSEEELAKMLEVSRGTLRKAISSLIKEGILIQIQGKGTFVAEPKMSHPFGQELISFAESMEREGIKFETKVIEKSLIQPKASIQQKFSLKDGESVLYLKRVRYIDNDPVIVLENYINVNLCEGIEQVDFENTHLFAAIEKISGRKIKFGFRQFEARGLEEEQALILSLPKGTPVLYLDQITYLEESKPVEISYVWLRSDKYSVASFLQRD
ncbi:GntR family transcriptional regulator [Lederbergia citrea]|uniref:GntR family transcriptional regulator n=1 Tax=Lederbergia citrea TaxID=2833581 RepID=UPI001BC94F83|nr:GntR family transcriptional regulator [Lederbergia citrea]MBS4178811.1 GntR family transcriptional regulator [Lederbergia citrea]